MAQPWGGEAILLKQLRRIKKKRKKDTCFEFRKEKAFQLGRR